MKHSSAVFERADVVGDLHYVVEGDAQGFLQLEQQQVRQRRLRAFDLRGQHRLAADIGVEKKVWIGQQGSNAIESSARQQCLFQQALALAGEV